MSSSASGNPGAGGPAVVVMMIPQRVGGIDLGVTAGGAPLLPVSKGITAGGAPVAQTATTPAIATATAQPGNGSVNPPSAVPAQTGAAAAPTKAS